MAQDDALARPGEADIGQSPFLFQSAGAAIVKRALMGKQPFLPSRQENDVELQTLCGVQRHDRDARFAKRAAFLRLHHQGDMFEKAGERFELRDRRNELLQVFQSASGVGR